MSQNRTCGSETQPPQSENGTRWPHKTRFRRRCTARQCELKIYFLRPFKLGVGTGGLLSSRQSLVSWSFRVSTWTGANGSIVSLPICLSCVLRNMSEWVRWFRDGTALVDRFFVLFLSFIADYVPSAGKFPWGDFSRVSLVTGRFSLSILKWYTHRHSNTGGSCRQL